MPVRVSDRGWNRVMTALRKTNGHFTKVGFPSEGRVKKPRKGHSKNMANLVQIAAIHEFGSPKKGIPERSFVRASHDESKKRLQNFINRELDRIYRGERTPEESIKRIGVYMAGRMKKKVKEGPFAPLSQRTIRAKGSSKPLIDTAQMVQSITHVEGRKR